MSNCSPTPGVFPTFGTVPLRPCSLQGDSWLSQVPELPPWIHALVSDPGGNLNTRPYRIQVCCLPYQSTPSAFPLLLRRRDYPNDHNYTYFYRACPQVQLLTCWLGFSQVGLSRTRFGITHWVTLTNFMGFLPIPRSRIYLGTRIDGLGKLPFHQNT